MISVFIIGNPSLTTFTIGSQAFVNTTSLILSCMIIHIGFSIDLPKLINITIDFGAFRYTNKLRLSSIHNMN